MKDCMDAEVNKEMFYYNYNSGHCGLNVKIKSIPRKGRRVYAKPSKNEKEFRMFRVQ